MYTALRGRRLNLKGAAECKSFDLTSPLYVSPVRAIIPS